ncbi:MAG: helix-turn-helix transcriptional regulator [Rikenellaceae bacterium]
MDKKVFDIKRFRKDNKISQVELAEILSCEQSYISNIERGIKALSPDKIDVLRLKYGDISGYITKSNRPSFSAQAQNGSTAVAGNGNKVGADPNFDKLLNEMSEQRKMYASQMDKMFAQLERRDEQIDKLINK